MDTSMLTTVVSACFEIQRRLDAIAGLKEDTVELQRKIEMVASVLKRAFDGVDISDADYVEDMLLEVKTSADKFLLVVKKAGKKSRLALLFKADKLLAKLKDCMMDLQSSLTTLTTALTAHNVGISKQSLDELRAVKDGVGQVQLANLQLLQGQAAILQQETKKLAISTPAGPNPAETAAQLSCILEEHLPDDLKHLLHDKEELQGAVKELQAQIADCARVKNKQEEHYLAQIVAALSFTTEKDININVPQPSASKPVINKEIPTAFQCPITSILMSDPVFTKVGSTYERTAISKWLETASTDPLTRQLLDSKDLLPNRALRDCIQQWRITVGYELPDSDSPERVAAVTRDEQLLARCDSPLKPYPTTKLLEGQEHTQDASTDTKCPSAPSVKVTTNDSQLPADVTLTPVVELQQTPESQVWHERLDGQYEFEASEELMGQKAYHFAAALANNQDVEKLTSKCTRLGDTGIMAVAAALQTNDTLAELDISHNNIQQGGATALANAISANRTLHTLLLTGNKLGQQGTEQLAAGLADSNTIRILNIADNSIGNAGATALSGVMSNLQQLFLQHNDISAVGIKAIASALSRNTSLLHLNVAFNAAKPAGAKALGTALANNTTLIHLDLQNNLISNAGLKSLATGLSKNSALQYINLASNELDAESVSELAKALNANSTLRSLDISFNSIKAKGAELLAEVLTKNKGLQVLVLSDNDIADAGVAALAGMLACNTVLSTLDLKRNNISSVGAKHLADGVATYKGLQQLDLRANPIGGEVCYSIKSREVPFAVQLPIPWDYRAVEWTNEMEDKPEDLGVAGAVPGLRMKSEAGFPAALANSSTLKSLELFDRLERIWPNLCLALETNLTLRSLKVHLKSTATAQTFAIALNNNTRLTSLSVSLSKDLRNTPEVFTLTSAIWRHTSLQTIEVYMCDGPVPWTLNGMGAALAVNTVLKELNLHGEFDSEAAKELATVLARNTTLRTLKLEKWCVSEDAAAWIQALETNSSLTCLELEKYSIDLGGAQAMAAMLTVNTTLQNFSMVFSSSVDQTLTALVQALHSNRSLKAVAFDWHWMLPTSVMEAMCSMLTVNITLQSFSIDNSFSKVDSVALVDAMRNNSTLTSLRLGEYIRDVDAPAFAEALSNNSSLTSLSLKLPYHGADALATMLAATCALQDLHIENCDDTSATTLANKLESNSSLKSLALRGIRLQTRGAKALGAMLAVNTTLQKLSLRDINAAAEGCIALAQALHTNATLTSLSLAWSKVGDSAVALADCLCKNTALQHLSLEHCSITDEGVQALAAAIKKNSTVRLNLGNNDMSKASRRLLKPYKDRCKI